MEIDDCQFCGQTAYMKPIYLNDEMHLVCYECFEKHTTKIGNGLILVYNNKIYYAEKDSTKFKYVYSISN